jgi:hypothetical protein
MIKKERYKKGAAPKARGHGPVMSNVRLRWTGPGRRTAGESRRVFLGMLETHRLPKGWEVAVVRWGHPQKGESLEEARSRLDATDGWTSGDLEELFEKFGGLFAHYQRKLQVGVVT